MKILVKVPDDIEKLKVEFKMPYPDEDGDPIYQEQYYRGDQLQSMIVKDEPCDKCKDGKITIHIPEFHAICIENEKRNHAAFDIECEYPLCPYCGRDLRKDVER